MKIVWRNINDNLNSRYQISNIREVRNKNTGDILKIETTNGKDKSYHYVIIEGVRYSVDNLYKKYFHSNKVIDNTESENGWITMKEYGGKYQISENKEVRKTTTKLVLKTQNRLVKGIPSPHVNLNGSYKLVDSLYSKYFYKRTIKEEIWKDIIGYEGKYEISNLGNVRNFKNKHILTITKDRHYQYVRLTGAKKISIKKLYERHFGVDNKYKIYALKYDNVIFFVGTTMASLKRRIRELKREACNENRMDDYYSLKNKFIREVGVENITIEVLESNIADKTDVGLRQMFYIKKFREEGLVLCNSTDGGNTMPKNMKSHWQIALQNGWVQKKIWRKPSKYAEGEARPNDKKQVYQYTLDGKLVKIWESTLATQQEGFQQPNVRGACLGKHKSHKGFKWSYIPLEEFENIES
jgi:hypothetical protein